MKCIPKMYHFFEVLFARSVVTGIPAAQSIVLLYNSRILPAYSPFLNIAENCFGVWKVGFKRQLAKVHPQLQQQTDAQWQATLIQIGAQNLEAITVERCTKSFRKTTADIPASNRRVSMTLKLNIHIRFDLHMPFEISCLLKPVVVALESWYFP